MRQSRIKNHRDTWFLYFKSTEVKFEIQEKHSGIRNQDVTANKTELLGKNLSHRKGVAGLFN